MSYIEIVFMRDGDELASAPDDFSTNFGLEDHMESEEWKALIKLTKHEDFTQIVFGDGDYGWIVRKVDSSEN